jgi:hypothetical protein
MYVLYGVIDRGWWMSGNRRHRASKQESILLGFLSIIDSDAKNIK